MKRTVRYPQDGDVRVKRRFLLIPRHFGLDWRWLEYANVLERYCAGWYCDSFWMEFDFADNRTRYLQEVEKKDGNKGNI